MKLNRWIFGFFFVFLVSGCAWALHGLSCGHRLMDRGDFGAARSEFLNVARYGHSDSERREGGYFVGFCSVKMHDPWQAISDFRWFLNRFDCGTRKYVPDALYVLGRTYEDRGERREAFRYYRRCIDRFPYSEFASKSRDRMHGGNSHYSMNYSIEAIPGKSVVSAKKADKKASKEDPFEGFSMDKKRLDRVDNFLNAVKENKDIEGAVKRLTAEDSNLSVVKESLKKVSEKQKFDKMHKAP